MEKQKLVWIHYALNELEDYIIGNRILPESIPIEQSSKGIKPIHEVLSMLEKLIESEKERQKVIHG